MFNIKNFDYIYDLIKKNKKIEAYQKLNSFRKQYSLHPDYLFLMANYLILDFRYYQSIDTIVASLKIDKDDMFLLKNDFEKSEEKLIVEKFNLLSYLFNMIDNKLLFNEIKNLKTLNEKNNFIKKLSKLMPGIRVR